MTEYTLHCFYESGNAYKPALFLALARASWNAQWVDFFNGATRQPEWRNDINVMGEVPVLIHHRDGGDFTVTQSGAILTYLSKQFGLFGPQTEAEEYEVLRWLLFDSQKVSGYAGPLRFLRHLKKAGETEAVQFLHGRFIAALDVMNKALDQREWIATDRCTIADLALCGYLYWPDEIGITYDDYPNVAAWLKRIESLPNYGTPAELMPQSADG